MSNSGSSQTNIQRGLLQALGGLIFGAGLAFFGVRAAMAATPSGRFEPIPWVGGSLVGLFLAIFLHELGHVAGGLSQGFRLYFFVVGPLRVSRRDGKLTFGLNRSFNLAGGLAACLPSDNHDLAMRIAVMTACGPLASLLSGLIFWWMSRLFAGTVGVFIFLAAITSLAVAVATMLPFKSGQFNSDGARLKMYWTDPKAMSRWANTAALSGLCFSDLSPRDWPSVVVEEVRQQVDGSYDGVGASMTLYYHAIGTGDARAGEYLDHFLENQDQYPEPFRPALRLEGAFYEGAVRTRADRARRWLDQSSGGVMIEPYTRLRAESAVLLSENRPQEAAAKAREALNLLTKSASNSLAQIERHLLDSILKTTDNARIS